MLETEARTNVRVELAAMIFIFALIMALMVVVNS